MQITIVIEDVDTLSNQDKGILALLSAAPAAQDKAKKDAPDKAKEAAPAAKKAAASKEAAPKPEAGEVTMKTAVDLATKLVSEGKAADVKAALATAGAKRVSELSGDAIASFVETLTD